jgi:hypothetical protein
MVELLVVGHASASDRAGLGDEWLGYQPVTDLNLAPIRLQVV